MRWSFSQVCPGRGNPHSLSGRFMPKLKRRYLESVAPYARRLFDQMGIPGSRQHRWSSPPRLLYSSRRGSPTTRSSVGSVTNLIQSPSDVVLACGFLSAGPTGTPRRGLFQQTARKARVHTVTASGASTTRPRQTMVPDGFIDDSGNGAIAAWAAGPGRSETNATFW